MSEETFTCAKCKKQLGVGLGELHDAWAIGGKGSRYWCGECLEGYFFRENLGSYNHLPVRWRWDETKQRAVWVQTDAEIIEALKQALSTSTVFLQVITGHGAMFFSQQLVFEANVRVKANMALLDAPPPAPARSEQETTP